MVKTRDIFSCIALLLAITTGISAQLLQFDALSPFFEADQFNHLTQWQDMNKVCALISPCLYQGHSADAYIQVRPIIPTGTQP